MDPELKSKHIANKEEELYFLQQVYKNLKYLNHMYETGKLKHESRAWYTQISVNNAVTEVSRAERELEQLKKQA
jgi:outer membrane translocation and assembly module TamA